MNRMEFVGTDAADPDLEFCVTVWEDGTATIAYRREGGTWGPQHRLERR